MFRAIRPEEVVDAETTEVLAKVLERIIASENWEHLIRSGSKRIEDSDFGSLSISKLGHHVDAELADLIFQELKSRGLADYSDDASFISIDETMGALILVLLAYILIPAGERIDLKLSPATDQWHVIRALYEIIFKPDSPSPSVGDVVSFDIDKVAVDLGAVPIDEILDFRQQNYRQHRDYIQSVRDFAHELSRIPSDERAVKFEQRREELKDLCHTLQNRYRGFLKKPLAFGIGLIGAAWTYHNAGPVDAAISAFNTAVGMMSDKSKEVNVYSYLISAKQRF